MLSLVMLRLRPTSISGNSNQDDTDEDEDVEMNRCEQENLYRTSRKLSLVPGSQSSPHIGLLGVPSEDGEERPRRSSRLLEESKDEVGGEDLVLSVLKSPVNHVEDSRYKDEEDDLTDCEPSEKLPFLQRLRGHHRVFEAHHKRVPTPLKRKQRFIGRHHKQQDVVTEADVLDEVEDTLEVGMAEVSVGGNGGIGGDSPIQSGPPRGVPDPYYPIYLPIDQAFKAKYVFHHKKGKTCQERTYVFMEHPTGWLCFIYHFSV